MLMCGEWMKKGYLQKFCISVAWNKKEKTSKFVDARNNIFISLQSHVLCVQYYIDSLYINKKKYCNSP